ncbi:hypothetical protein GEMRC1_000888 [Eukaryota sp. GEM-RC1]
MDSSPKEMVWLERKGSSRMIDRVSTEGREKDTSFNRSIENKELELFQQHKFTLHLVPKSLRCGKMRYIIFFLAHLVLLSLAFDRQKWKFCKDFEHCTYHRDRLRSDLPPLILSSFPSLNSDSSLSFSLTSHEDPSTIDVKLSFYDDCIFRFEANNGVDRYHSEHAIADPPLSFSVDCSSTDSNYICSWGDCLLSIPAEVGSSFTLSAGNDLASPSVLLNSNQFLYLSPSPGSIALDFTFPSSTSLHGLPEHSLPFSLPSTLSSDEPIRLFNLDVFQYEVDSSFPLYGSVPFLFSRGPSTTAVFWNNPSDSYVDIDHSPTNSTSYFYSESSSLDAFILLGPTPTKVFSQWRSITGSFPPPPDFALGYHQCKWNYRDEKDVLKLLDEFETRDLPVDTIWLDIEHTKGKRYFTWDPRHFPDPEGLQNTLWSLGRRMVTITDPHIKKDSSYHVHKQALAKNVYIMNSDKKTPFEGHCWPGTSHYIDYLNPEARSFWAELYKSTNYKGKTHTLHQWNDMNEFSVFNHAETTAPRDVMHFDGSQWVENRQVHNLYGFLMHSSTKQGLLLDNPGSRPFILTRSFFAGSGSTGVAVWTGDNTADWNHLRISIPMLLSLSISGIPFVGADIGGFFDHPDAELITRWYQLGAWYPFMRSHAHLDSPRREPWLYGKETESRIRKVLIQRYSYLPYWKLLFKELEDSGVPPLRPLWMIGDDFVDNEEVLLVGNDILVVPVLSPGQTSLSLDLPSNTEWFDVRNGQEISNNFVFNVDVDSIPVLQRAGSIIPRKFRLRRSTAFMVLDPITLDVAVDREGTASGRYYNDDGVSYDYQSNKIDDAVIEMGNNSLCWTVQEKEFKKIEIERICLFGVSSPVSVTNEGIDIDFFSDNGRLVIKKPNVFTNEDWCLQFNF